ncbi:MAG: 50S ribosomal protein L25 [Candidatus Andersenbacteria bacterium CG10_big_fil_rev_8_21_14_0_10_54_11]|uniref:Large ribosomal subunit protein bL25 n=1 Tax=Candidatus Andersenbacteria bacterium CG10_big_fil_rev_8_21_14_0_10_54_11 TaxID=1974485 RepID=A0A2M6WZV4_9BACT|nr:MAG: 50S ribosomal protein L25 [Candidatus Andersenbacteria bacterium CG10_big_fil_rev_8_21_14_0_10_54_11]
MAQKIQLDASARSDAAKTHRRRQEIPAVLYGANIPSVTLAIRRAAFERAFAAAGYTTLIELAMQEDTGAREHLVLVREVQRHPLKNTITHIDFYQPRLDRKIHADVPLHFTGESPAVKNLAGILIHPLEEVEIEALPADLPHTIEVDISILTDFDTAIHIKDLVIPAGVDILNEAEELVAAVQKPKSEEELEAALAEPVAEEVDKVEKVEDKGKAEEGDDAAEVAEDEEKKG